MYKSSTNFIKKINKKHALTLPTRLSAEPITSKELGLRSAGLPGKECASLMAPAWPLGSPLTTETDHQ